MAGPLPPPADDGFHHPVSEAEIVALVEAADAQLQAERDPNNIFLTDYWHDRLGLWDEPPPAARGA